MYRVLTSSNRAVAQRVARSTLTFTRAASYNDPEAGSVGGGQDAFGKKEKAEETRWARRFEAEQAQKFKTQHNKFDQAGNQPKGDHQAADHQDSASEGAGGTPQQQIAALEAEKKRIEQQIKQLKRQQS